MVGRNVRRGLVPESWNAKLFKDRKYAGIELAKVITKFAGDKPVILALPRGGVIIGYEIAKALNSSLDVIVARKIGLPHNKEFGIGAIAEDDVRLLDKQVIDRIGIPNHLLEEIIAEEKKELDRRIQLYRKNKPLPNLKNKTAIIVDDGLATGLTAKAAIAVIKKQKPKRLIFACPVCAYDAAQDIRFLVNEVVCLATPLNLVAIGRWYNRFEQVSDKRVLELLKRSRKEYKQEQ